MLPNYETWTNRECGKNNFLLLVKHLAGEQLRPKPAVDFWLWCGGAASPKQTLIIGVLSAVWLTFSTEYLHRILEQNKRFVGACNSLYSGCCIRLHGRPLHCEFRECGLRTGLESCYELTWNFGVRWNNWEIEWCDKQCLSFRRARARNFGLAAADWFSHRSNRCRTSK